LFKKEEIKLIFIGIVISAYMAMSYDIVQALMINPYENILPKAVAGLVSMGVGGTIVYFFTRK
jgi:hypothetical protein